MSRRDTEQLLRRIKQRGGYSHRIDGQGHWEITNTVTGDSTRIPRTPSDYRGFRNSLRDLKRIGYNDRYKKPPKKKRRRQHMPNLSQVAQVTAIGGKSVREPPDVITDARGAGRFLWEVIRDLAQINNGAEPITHEGATGYRWSGRLTVLATSLWPDDLKSLGTKERTYRVSRIRDPLTALGNLVVLHPGNPSTPTTFFVRAEWNDTPPAKHEATPPAKPEAAPPAKPEAAPPEVKFTPPSERVSEPPTVAPERPAEPTTRPPTPAVGGSVSTAEDKPATRPIDVEQMLAFLTQYDVMSREREQLAELFTQMQKVVTAIGEVLGGRGAV